MQWLKADSVPEECKGCREECYNCDVAGKRWSRSRADELRTNRILKVKAIQRLQREIEKIDKELLDMANQ